MSSKRTTNNWNKPKTDIEKAADLLEQDELYHLWGKRVRAELAALTADRDRLAAELAEALLHIKTLLYLYNAIDEDKVPEWVDKYAFMYPRQIAQRQAQKFEAFLAAHPEEPKP